MSSAEEKGKNKESRGKQNIYSQLAVTESWKDKVFKSPFKFKVWKLQNCP